MKVVKVYGALRKRLGQCRFEFDVNTPSQAIKALCVNFPGLDKWLIDSEQDGVGYRVAVSKEKISQENVASLLMPFSDREVFSITPVVTGAGRGVGAILAGVALIAVSLVVPGAGVAGTSFLASAGSAATFGAGVAAAAGSLGVALVLGGVAQAISPQPEPSSLEESAQSAQLESFSFSNVVNTSRQGLACPIAYGRLFVGSAVLSSGLDVDQVQA